MNPAEFDPLLPPLAPPAAGTRRRAVIDVGTNSVKLLVVDLRGDELHPVLEQSEQTRLGAGFYETHQLQPGAIAKTAAAVATFVRAARASGAAPIRIIGTSAARDARNAAELCAAIQHAAGLPLEIISGEQEADWAFHGVATDPQLAGHPLLILDVGGGSTEFILGAGQHQQFRESFPLGSVRLLEKFPVADPPSAADWQRCHNELERIVARQILPHLAPALARVDRARLHLVGTGGATTILARIHTGMTDFDRARIEAVRLTRAAVQRHREHLWSLPLAQRRNIPGLPPNRADVILYGVAIYEAILQHLDLPELRVSTRGLRFAAVLDLPAP
ncbi:phosphatase [Verrucomicrobiota bacterium]|nr:phosphatase [Verrucomicrobiota bacterium]